MLLSVDIDQFLIIYMITQSYMVNNINNICLNNNRFIGFNYLPKELFNMSQIKVIFADTLNKMGCIYSYGTGTKVRNHDSCRWENLINLNTVFWLMNTRVDKNKDIIKVLRSL